MTDDLPEWLRAFANRAPLITHERERLEEAAALIVSLREEKRALETRLALMTPGRPVPHHGSGP